MINFTEKYSLLQPILDEASSRYSRQQDFDIVAEHQFRFQQFLQAAMSFMDSVAIPYLNHVDDRTVTDVWSSEPHAIVFGIDILIDILLEQVETFHPLSRLLSTYTYCRLSLAAEVRVIRESVFQRGRCQSLVGRFHPLSKAWHRIILLPHTGVVEDHSACSLLHCRVNDVDEKTYETQHTNSCSGCAHIHSDPQDIITAISTHKIPLVHCSLDDSQDLRIRIVEGDLDFQYTAISHVWTGGLGNLSENSLPRCQISRLRTMIQDLPDMQVMNVQHIGQSDGNTLSEKLVRLVESAWNVLRSRKTVYFWLDTLCIPLNEEYRQKAIATMAQIYAAAETVLVLDSHMQQLLHVEATDPILATHLTVSPWMSRSWPLQEGAVASNLAIRLKDQTVFLTRDQQRRLLHVSLHLTDCLFENRLSQNPSYKAVWNALACRGTTKRGDLDGIFAALLNLDSGEILELPKTERMKAIISTQKSIPLTLLCQPREKDEVANNTWIPPFPDTSTALVLLDDFHGSLIAEHDGFSLAISDDSLTFGILVQDSTLPQQDFIVKDSYNESYYGLFVDIKPSNIKTPTLTHGLFVLTFDRVTGSLKYRGSQFEILSNDHATTKLKFITSCVWEHYSGADPGHPVLVGSRFTELGNPSHKVLLVEGRSNHERDRCFRRSSHPTILHDFSNNP